VLGQLPNWEKEKRICVDLETRDPQLKKLGPGVRRDGYIIGLGFAIDGGPSAYMPTRHANGTNMDEDQVFEYWAYQAKHYRGEIVGANLSYDLDYLAERGIIFRQASFFRDVQIAEPLLDELQMSYSLDNIAARRGIEGKDETLMKAAAAAWGVDSKAGMWELPPEFVGAYGEQDCRVPLEILRQQEAELSEQGLLPVWDLESRLLPVLVKMRRRGIRVDFDRLDEVSTWSTEREVSALARITHLTGINLTTSDTTKTSALVPVMEQMGIDFNKPEFRTDPTKGHPNGQPSIKNDWLKSLPQHDILDAILEARKFNKLNGTFVKSIRTHAIGDRIHCTFKQMVGESEGSDESTGAKYGRLSCTGPNLQQQPARDPEIGPIWRSIYIPDEGKQFAVLDFSQQEPRWLVHYAELLQLPKAAAMAERYRTDPTADNHDMMATLINAHWPSLSAKFQKAERSVAKVIFLGLCYGMGPAKLARSLGMKTKMRKFTARDGRVVRYLGAGDEAQALLDKFRKGVPFVKALMKKAEEKAAKVGFILTVEGRRCRFPKVWNAKTRKWEWDMTHKAGNRLIQGSAGGQTKTAMVKADEAGIPIQLQVHDEIDFSFEDPEMPLRCAKIMRHAVPCNVPHKVDIETGPNWGDISTPEWAI
tara:strand:- start:32574 stop:34517 length:1944 start_codon:yes stop_codon:yes gene_type:complete